MLTEAQLEETGELADALDRPAFTVSGLGPGLHAGIPDAIYHFKELGVVSKSAIDRVRKSPAHYKAWADGLAEGEETPALAFGRAIHMRVLEPELFARRYVVAPAFGDCRKTANKAARDAWRAEHASATILDAADGAATLGMIDSIAEHPIARPLLEGGLAELTVRWDDEDTGLVCKARADFYRGDLHTVVDIKSALDASFDSFRRSVANFGYHRQEAHYSNGFAAVGEELEHFVFVVVEKTPPYAVAIYSLDAAAVGLGERQVDRAMQTLADCLVTDEWPAYPQTIQAMQLPAWVKDDE